MRVGSKTDVIFHFRAAVLLAISDLPGTGFSKSLGSVSSYSTMTNFKTVGKYAVELLIS